MYLSSRNIQKAHVLPYSDVSTYHILWSDVVLVESAALGSDLKPLAEKTLPPVKVRRFVPRAARGTKGETGDGVATDPAAPKGARTVRTRKSPAVKTAARKPATRTAAPKAKAKSAPKAAAKKKPAAKKPAPKKKGK